MPSMPYNPTAPDPTAPHGRAPVTGEPLSDKTEIAAGLMQIFLGQWGVGRFYLGDSMQVLIHIGLWVISFSLILCGIAYSPLAIVGLLVFLGNLGWALVDGIMILSGKVRDGQGRKLR